MAKSELMFLNFEARALEKVAESIAATFILGLIARGLFYAVVIGEKGGALENEVTAEEVMTFIVNLLYTVFSHLVVGIIFDIEKTMREAREFWKKLRNTENLMEGDQRVLRRVNSYISEYNKSLDWWFALFSLISDGTVKQVKAYL